MRLRLFSAMAVAVLAAATLGMSSCPNQNSGSPAHVEWAKVDSMGFQQTYTNPVFANTYFDKWDGFVPFNTKFSRNLKVFGSVDPPVGTTLDATELTFRPFIVCPGESQTRPTIPPTFTVPLKLNPTEGKLTFSEKLHLTLPECPAGPTSTGTNFPLPHDLNFLRGGTYLEFDAKYNRDVHIGTNFKFAFESFRFDRDR